MIEPKKDESRIEYLCRVLHIFMNTTVAGECRIGFDDMLCDGVCLAQDIINELGVDIE